MIRKAVWAPPTSSIKHEPPVNNFFPLPSLQEKAMKMCFVFLWLSPNCHFRMCYEGFFMSKALLQINVCSYMEWNPHSALLSVFPFASDVYPFPHTNFPAAIFVEYQSIVRIWPFSETVKMSCADFEIDMTESLTCMCLQTRREWKEPKKINEQHVMSVESTQIQLAWFSLPLTFDIL